MDLDKMVQQFWSQYENHHISFAISMYYYFTLYTSTIKDNMFFLSCSFQQNLIMLTHLTYISL
jgi:hypothetical protein